MGTQPVSGAEGFGASVPGAGGGVVSTVDPGGWVTGGGGGSTRGVDGGSTISVGGM